MRKIIIFSILLFCFAACAHAAEKTDNKNIIRQLNLKEAVQTGLERNPRIRAMNARIKSSGAQARSVRGRFLPSLSASYNRNYLDNIHSSGNTDSDYLNQTQDTLQLILRQTLYAGQTIFNAYQKAQIQKKAERLRKENEKIRLIRRIQENFLLLLKAREDRTSLEQTIERLQVSLDAARAFEKQKMVPYVQVLQARVDLENALQQLSQAQNEETIRKTRLNALLDFQDRDNIVYAGNLADINLKSRSTYKQCLEKALEKRSDLQLARTNIEIAARDEKIAHGEMLPRVNLDLKLVDYIRDYDQMGQNAVGQPYDRDQKNLYWSAGITVEWNFFSGGQKYYKKQSRQHEIQRLKNIFEDTLSTVRTEVLYLT